VKDLQSLSEKILMQTKEKGQLELEKAEKNAIAKIEESRLKLVEQQKNRKQTILKKSADDFERERQTLKNKERNALLSEKQVILNAVFSEATEKMKKWDMEQFNTLLDAILSQLDATKKYSVVPGEKSLSHFQGEQLKRLNRKFPDIQISKETIPNQSGFIIEEGGIDYNYGFDALIAEVKMEYTSKLASLAFREVE